MTTALFSGLSPEDLIAEEEEHQGTELSARSTLGKRAAPSEDSDHESQGGEEEQTSPRNENPPSRPGSTTHQNPGSLRIEQAIRRTAKRLKLPNEDISLLETFTQETSLDVRLMLLYSSTIAVRNELAELQRSIGTASYQVGDELEDNIKKYSRLVLLSPSIYHYKGKMPKEYLTKIILKYRFGIPKNIEANGHAWAKITACVDYELTQARGALKKVLKKDAKLGDAQAQSTIYQLSRTMLSDETYKISPATCTRVAIMREVYISCTDSTYWDKVDVALDSIQKMPEGQRFSYLKAILLRDRRTYGVEPGTMAAMPSDDGGAADGESLIQQRVRDFIEAPGGVAVD